MAARGRGWVPAKDRRSTRVPSGASFKKKAATIGTEFMDKSQHYFFVDMKEAEEWAAKILPPKSGTAGKTYGFAGGRVLYVPADASSQFFRPPLKDEKEDKKKISDQCSHAMYIVKASSGVLGIPGGKPEEKEVPWITASREVKEETGWTHEFKESDYLFSVVTTWPAPARPHVGHMFTWITDNKSVWETAMSHKPDVTRGEVLGVVGMPLYAEYNPVKRKWFGLPEFFSMRGGSEKTFGIQVGSLLEFWLTGVLEWDERAVAAFQYSLSPTSLSQLALLTTRPDMLAKRASLLLARRKAESPLA